MHAAELRGEDVADVGLQQPGDLQPPGLLVVPHQALLALLLLEVEAVGAAHGGAHVVFAGGRGLGVVVEGAGVVVEGAGAEVVGVLAVLLAVLADLGLDVLVDLLAQLHLGLLQGLLLAQLLVP